jgi:ribonuclease HI
VAITAAADGSALGNPGPAGWAWYVDDRRWAAGGWPHGTNNQGELKAVLDLFESTAHLPAEELHVLCDSQYVINAVTKWMPGWKRKGWRKADGKPVLNVELLKQLDTALTGRRYRFEWIKGHAGHALNEAADERARAVATAFQLGTSIPHGPGWEGNEVSEVETIVSDIPAAVSDIETVVELEQQLMRPEVRRDPARVSELLHPQFEEIGTSGRMWTRDSMLNAIGNIVSNDPQFEMLGVDKLDATTVLLTYASHDDRGRILRSSLWLSDGSRWRLRFHQGTPAGG